MADEPFRLKYSESYESLIENLPEHGEHYTCVHCGKMHKEFDQEDMKRIIREAAQNLAEAIDKRAYDAAVKEIYGR